MTPHVSAGSPGVTSFDKFSGTFRTKISVTDSDEDSDGNSNANELNNVIEIGPSAGREWVVHRIYAQLSLRHEDHRNEISGSDSALAVFELSEDESLQAIPGDPNSAGTGTFFDDDEILISVAQKCVIGYEDGANGTCFPTPTHVVPQMVWEPPEGETYVVRHPAAHYVNVGGWSGSNDSNIAGTNEIEVRGSLTYLYEDRPAQ